MGSIGWEDVEEQRHVGHMDLEGVDCNVTVARMGEKCKDLGTPANAVL